MKTIARKASLEAWGGELFCENAEYTYRVYMGTPARRYLQERDIFTISYDGFIELDPCFALNLKRMPEKLYKQIACVINYFFMTCNNLYGFSWEEEEPADLSFLSFADLLKFYEQRVKINIFTGEVRDRA